MKNILGFGHMHKDKKTYIFFVFWKKEINLIFFGESLILCKIVEKTCEGSKNIFKMPFEKFENFSFSFLIFLILLYY